MSSESELIVELWDMVRDHLPTSKRLDTAIHMLKTLEEYGFDPKDMRGIIDEDRYLARAFVDLFEDELEEEDEDDEGDY